MCVCVCVRESERVCVCMYVRVCERECLCERERARVYMFVSKGLILGMVEYLIQILNVTLCFVLE